MAYRCNADGCHSEVIKQDDAYGNIEKVRFATVKIKENENRLPRKKIAAACFVLKQRKAVCQVKY